MLKFLNRIIAIIFPDQCLACSKIVSFEGLFCSPCWQKLQFITDPKCVICCHPFEYASNSSQLICSKCIMKKPAFDKVISLFRYNNIIGKIIGDFKYRDATFLAKKLVKILYSRLQKDLEDIDLIIAVPLHKKRLQKRKFNQAIFLAKEISKYSKKELSYDFLLRVKHTKTQVELRQKQREINLKNAFEINKKYLDLVKGKNILLIDDVMTTGTTLESCAKILKKAGAKNVTCLTIAKRVFNSSN